MRRGFVVLSVLAMVGLMMGAGALWAQQTKSGKVDDVIVLKSSVFKKHKKGWVRFPHKAHSVDYKIACTECHHIYKDGKNIFKPGMKVKKCEECHTSPRKNKGKMLSLYNAFHKNCRGCHKKAKKGPTKCNQCHPKKK